MFFIYNIMKNLKLYEGLSPEFPFGRIGGEHLSKRSEEYQNKYKGKYIVLEYQGDNLYLGKFITTALNGYYAKIEIYEWNSSLKGYEVTSIDPVHITDINILDSFDNFSDAKKAYEMMLDSKRYNI